MNKLMGQKTNGHLLPQKYYFSIAKTPGTFWRIFGSFQGL